MLFLCKIMSKKEEKVMRRLPIGILLVVVALMLVAVGCGPAKPVEEKVNISLYASSPAVAPPYHLAVQLMQLINDLHPQWAAAAMPGMGDHQVWKTIDELSPELKKHAINVGTPSTGLAIGWAGEGMFVRPYPDFKVIGGGYLEPMVYVTFDPAIKGPQDMIGKRVATHRQGDAPEILGRGLLRAWGILDKVELSYHSAGDFKDVLVTGVADVAFAGGGTLLEGGKWGPAAFTAPIVAARDTYWITATEEDVRKINETEVWETELMLIPKDAMGKNYPLHDVHSITFWTNFGCFDVAEEELIYEFVKFLNDNAAEYTRRTGGFPMSAAHMASLFLMTEENCHPGALRYYKEKGVKIGR